MTARRHVLGSAFAAVVLACSGCAHLNPRGAGYAGYYESGNPLRAPGLLQNSQEGAISESDKWDGFWTLLYEFWPKGLTIPN